MEKLHNLPQLQKLAIAPTQIKNDQIVLTNEQQHYLVRVLRLREGDRFIAIDSGKWWLVSLEETTTTGKIEEALLLETELPVTVTLMIALPKGNAFDDVVRQVTELGVNCIAPVISDRTIINPSSQKIERWRRIAQEAAEQSERQIVPNILDPVSFSTALSETSVKNCQSKYICVTRSDSPHLLNCLQSLQNFPSSIVIATGSEGGWTEAEVEQALNCGFQPVSLGRRILRAVTAPVCALSLIAAVWEQSI